MFRFLYPATEAAAFELVIDAPTIAVAFEEYRQLWWDDNWIGSVAVFERERLVARVVPEADPETGRNEPRLDPWPGAVTQGNRFACGD